MRKRAIGIAAVLTLLTILVLFWRLHDAQVPWWTAYIGGPIALFWLWIVAEVDTRLFGYDMPDGTRMGGRF